MLRLSVSLLGAATLALSAKTGYFDSQVCADPSGMEKCYKDGEEAWAAASTPTARRDEINCAASHCWNQAYSCEYQETAGDVATYCLNPDLSDIPFYPPPDDAPGACSCNLGKLLTSLYRTTNELETCGKKGEEIVKEWETNGSPVSPEEIQLFSESCICCGQSAQLSAFFEVCPNTDPSLLGLNEVYNGLVGSREEEWLKCGDVMSQQWPCGKEGLDYTPPGGNSSGRFYEPDNFPASGTESLTNMLGTITAPLSSETFTWTMSPFQPMTVTIASADARPTDKSNNNDGSGGDGGSGGSNGNDGDGKDGDNGNGDSAASVLSPGLGVIVGVLLMLLTLF